MASCSALGSSGITETLPAELDQDWIFAVEEMRKVRRDATVSYRSTCYQVPAQHIGDHVWLHLVDSKVVITHAGKTIAEHPLRVQTLADTRT
jgi:hypothetical protein